MLRIGCMIIARDLSGGLMTEIGVREIPPSLHDARVSQMGGSSRRKRPFRQRRFDGYSPGNDLFTHRARKLLVAAYCYSVAYIATLVGCAANSG